MVLLRIKALFVHAMNTCAEVSVGGGSIAAPSMPGPVPCRILPYMFDIVKRPSVKNGDFSA